MLKLRCPDTKMQSKLYTYIPSLSLLFVCFSLISQQAKAQIVPLAAQYYLNQYLGNPAFAGFDDGLRVNIAYRNQWRAIPGSPVTQSLSGDYRLPAFEGGKAGIGLNIYSDNAGLIKRTRIMGSYAYHLPLDGGTQIIHFGLSLGMMNERLDNESIIADPNDVLADLFNQRKTYIDGDFGVIYTNERMTIQGTVPNLKKFLRKDNTVSVDGSTFFMAISYKMGRNPDVLSLQPKFCLRGAQGIENLWDLGSDLSFSDKVTLMAMYHSSQSSTVALSINYLNKCTLQGVYSSQLAGQREATGGSFEINLKVPLKLKDKVKSYTF